MAPPGDKKTINKRQNTIATFGVKGVCHALGAVGIANMWHVIFADTGIGLFLLPKC
ncbi:MAG: hypothetical protein KBT09_00270 [Bacteroidales bacterium]|nr:hypothetical protein [Candidatus Sodaliphilus fimicaballi]